MLDLLKSLLKKGAKPLEAYETDKRDYAEMFILINGRGYKITMQRAASWDRRVDNGN